MAFSSRALSGNCLRPSGTRLSNSSCASLGNVAMCVLRRACYRAARFQSTLTAENAGGPRERNSRGRDGDSPDSLREREILRGKRAGRLDTLGRCEVIRVLVEHALERGVPALGRRDLDLAEVAAGDPAVGPTRAGAEPARPQGRG